MVRSDRIMSVFGPIHADPHTDPVFEEQLDPPGLQQGPVGLDDQFQTYEIA